MRPNTADYSTDAAKFVKKRPTCAKFPAKRRGGICDKRTAVPWPRSKAAPPPVKRQARPMAEQPQGQHHGP